LKLEDRDKKTLIIGGILAAVIVLYTLVFSPLMSDLSRKRDAIPKKEKELAEMKVLKSEYENIQQQLQAAQAAAAKRGPLLTEIENITRRANLGGKIVSLKPQTGAQTAGFRESVVEVRLESVALYDIVNYVFQLERETLRIRKLQFKPRYDNPKLLNATLLVSSAESS
jgi:type II secretory pathway component PulM